MVIARDSSCIVRVVYPHHGMYLHKNPNLSRLNLRVPLKATRSGTDWENTDHAIHVAEKPQACREGIMTAIGSCIFQRHLLDRTFVCPFDVGSHLSPGSAKGSTR